MCLVGDAGGNHHTSRHMGTLFWGTLVLSDKSMLSIARCLHAGGGIWGQPEPPLACRDQVGSNGLGLNLSVKVDL